MQLMPRKVNVLIKAEYAQRGQRYQKPDQPATPLPEREERKIYPKRIAARLGLLPYYQKEINAFADYTPSRVEIPLGQHIGQSAEPVVKVGDWVKGGEKVAACPDGALGANIHASIDGRVAQVGERIVIVTESEVQSR